MDERSSSLTKRQRADAFTTGSDAPPATGDTMTAALTALAEELECPVCSKLLYEPVTTPCGHTFCRTCLARALDARDTCALCRAVVHMGCARDLPITRALHSALELALPHLYAERAAEVIAERCAAPRRLPLLPLGLVVFPTQKLPLHIFEPRYRLMLRRVLAGSKRFGLVALRGDPPSLCDVGVVLEVTTSVPIPDGRSMIETIARERFRVIDYEEIDGYLVARTEPFEDIVDAGDIAPLLAQARTLVTRLLADGKRFSRDGRFQDALHKMCNVRHDELSPSALSLWLAGMLVKERAERQRLLEMKDAKARLAEMTLLLQSYCESLDREVAAAAAGEPAQNRDCVLQ